ncbi:MAG TPA: PKD domain-containing protein [Candidatus Binatia bacterium]|jgi:PKD repeat protein
MTPRRRFLLSRRTVLSLVAGIAIPMLATGPAAAFYPPDGAKPDGSGGYMIPADGMCVIGINGDGTATGGTMQVDWSITNARDCAAYTKSADSSVDLKSMTTQAACTNAGSAGNDGYKHVWSTSICYDTVNSRGISRVDLDNTAGMCTSLGGTIVTTGKCVAYGWIYRNRKADGTLPVSGSGISTTSGVQFSDGLGFCATTMRMTSASYSSTATCPSFHNSATTSPGEWPACASVAAPGGCQTQTAYDLGLGWTFTSPNCLFTYGVKGAINATATNADGSTLSAGTVVDLTAYTSQAGCLVHGFVWDNWLPNATTTLEDNSGNFTGIPVGSKIRRLDAHTTIANGGGNYYSGTGAICTKCHTDQSRSYAERNKPGYVKTGHRMAGDATGEPFQPFFTASNSDWGLQGVECAMCHSTAKPARDDLIQVVTAGIVGPPPAGAPKSASGHNQTEEGSHVMDVCYTCHGQAASPSSVNPATVIPVSHGEFKLTGKGLKPIVNMFLNSPHAQYSGNSDKVDIGNKTKYHSFFVGYVCRDANSIGGGNELGTIVRNGVKQSIPLVDTATNPACTNPADGGATSGAGGFWVPEGETVVAGGSPPDTAQGNCSTCHDVHWSLNDTSAKAEPLRRECDTCHEKNLAIIKHPAGTGTPLQDVATDPAEACVSCHMPNREHLFRINVNAAYSAFPDASLADTTLNTSPDGTYTNAAWVDLDQACGQCHGGGTSQASTTGSSTAGSPVVTVASISGFTAGQRVAVGGTFESHILSIGAGSLTLATSATDTLAAATVVQNPTKGGGYMTKTTLATKAAGMHNDAPTVYFGYTYGSSSMILKVNATQTICLNTCDVYDWDWGDGTAHGSGVTSTHTYAAGGTFAVTLTVTDFGAGPGSKTKNIKITQVDNPPTVAGVCAFNANTWTEMVSDLSSDDIGLAKVTVNWGDGSTVASDTTSPYGPFTHVYLVPGTFTVSHTAYDTIGQQKTQAAASCPAATPSPFKISGTVFAPNGTTPLASAVVQAIRMGVVVKGVYTDATGAYSMTGLTPGAYSLKVSKSLYTFAFPAASKTVGPDQPGTNITAVTGP